MSPQIPMAIVEERDVPVRDLVPHPKNWRTHPAAQREALRQVLERLGWIQRVIVNRTTGHLLDGHLRAELAAGLGEETVPVQYVEIPEAEEALVLATLDPIAGMAGMASEAMAALLRDVEADGELQALLGDLAAAAARRAVKDTEPLWVREAKRMAAKWGTATGQTWSIDGGRHEILIADSADPEVQSRARARWDVEAVVTDPPFDADAGDVAGVLDALAERAVVLCAGPLAYGLFGGRAGWRTRLDLVWRFRTGRSMPTRARPVPQHAWILLLSKGKASLGWRRPWPAFGSVLEVEREFDNHVFGHAKSAELFVAMMAGFRWTRWIDPYVGAGTSILAAHHLSKQILGVERDPGIAALGLERLTATGLSVAGPST